jgi:hypothetical protein
MQDLILHKIIKQEETTIYDSRIDTVILQDDLEVLASIDSIKSVEEQYEEQDKSNIARTILNYPVTLQVIDPAKALRVPVHYEGAGQVIDVAIVDSISVRPTMCPVHLPIDCWEFSIRQIISTLRLFLRMTPHMSASQPCFVADIASESS